MTKNILRYEITQHELTLMLPDGTTLLSFQEKNDTPCLWVLSDVEAPLVPRRFKVFSTGTPIVKSEGLEYVGTCVVRKDGYVFHLFEQELIIRERPR